MCSTQEDVRESKSPRAILQGWPTSIYRHPQHEIVVRDKLVLPAHWPDALVVVTGRGHSVRSHLHDFPDERHVSRFESRSFDRNGHLKVLVYALEWPNASIKINRTRLGVQSPLIRVADHATRCAACTDWTPQCQCLVDSSKHPLMT
jgi:hypothetical protein